MKQRARSRSLLRWLKIVAIYGVVIFLLAELILRLMGYSTFSSFPHKLSGISPRSSMQADDVLGFSLRPGTFTYNYASGYAFQARHLADGRRDAGTASPAARKKIDFYGGSLFYGMGLNDHEVFTHLLQTAFPDDEIRNYAIMGHSMVSSYLSLKRHIEAGQIPEIAVVSYASYNLPRNVYSIPFRKNLVTNSDLNQGEELSYCYARLAADDTSRIEFHLDDFDYSPFWLSNYSALSNLVEETWNGWEHESYAPKQVEQILIDQLLALCEKHHVKLVFACVNGGGHTDAIKAQLTAENLNVVDIFVDYKEDKYNLLPHDNHPNALAHTIYADRLIPYLQALRESD